MWSNPEVRKLRFLQVRRLVQDLPTERKETSPGAPPQSLCLRAPEAGPAWVSSATFTLSSAPRCRGARAFGCAGSCPPTPIWPQTVSGASSDLVCPLGFSLAAHLSLLKFELILTKVLKSQILFGYGKFRKYSLTCLSILCCSWPFSHTVSQSSFDKYTNTKFSWLLNISLGVLLIVSFSVLDFRYISCF